MSCKIINILLIYCVINSGFKTLHPLTTPYHTSFHPRKPQSISILYYPFLQQKEIYTSINESNYNNPRYHEGLALFVHNKLCYSSVRVFLNSINNFIIQYCGAQQKRNKIQQTSTQFNDITLIKLNTN